MRIDRESQWLPALPQLLQALPELFVFGAYDPGRRTGPGNLAALDSQWNVSDPRAGDQQVFAWEEGRRDTSLAASRFLDLRQQGVDVPCVWSARHVREANRLSLRF